MPQHNIPTGFSAFDEFCGGLNTGESLLLLSDAPAAWLTWCAAWTASASHRSRFLLLSAPGRPLPRFYDVSRRFLQRTVEPAVRHSAVLRRTLLKTLRGITPGTIILIEDLASLQSGKGVGIRDWFDVLAGETAKRGCILFGNVTRGAVPISDLAYLKDRADICAEVVLTGGEMHILPVTIKHRYKPALESRRMFRLSLSADGASAPAEPGSSPTADVPDFTGELFQKFSEPLARFRGKREPVDLNLRALALLGVSRDEFLAGQFRGRLEPGHSFRLGRFILAIGEQKSGTVSFAFRRGRQLRHVTAHCVSVGRGLNYAFLRDTTDEAAVSRHAEELEHAFHTFLEEQTLPFVLLQDRKISFLSRSFRETFGYPVSEEAPLPSPADLFTAEGVRQIRQTAGRAEEKQSRSLVLNVRRAGGDTAICQAAVAPVTFRGERSIQISLTDITALIRLRDRLELRARMLERLPGPAALVRDGKFVYCNAGFLKYFGFSDLNEVEGRPHTLIEQQKETSVLTEQCARKQFQRQPVRSFLVRAVSAAGTAYTLRATAAMPADMGGDLLLLYEDASEEIQWKADAGQFGEELEYLNGLLESLHVRADIPRVAAAAIQKFTSVFSWKCAGLFLHNPGTDEFDLSSHRNLPVLITEKLAHLPAGEGLGGFLAKTQEPHQFLLSAYPAYLPHRSLFHAAHIHTLGLVPLLSGMNVVGFVLLASTDPEMTPVYSHRLYSLIGRELGASLARGRTIEQLENELSQLRAMTANGEDVYYQLSPDGVLLTVTENIEQMLGYRPREFLRNRSLWLSLLHQDDKRVLLERATRLSDIRERHTAEYRIFPKGKATPISARDTLTVQYGKDERISGYVGILRDTTAERSLVGDLEERLRHGERIVAMMPDAVATCDAQWRISAVNAEMEKLTGREQADLTGKLITEIFHPDDEAAIAQLLKRAFAGERGETDGARLRQKKQQAAARHCWMKCAPVPDPDGAVRQAVVLLADVSDMQARETALRTSEQILRNVIDAMGDIFIITDLDGTVRQINKSFERMLGYPAADAINCTFPYPWLVEEEMGRYILWITSLREKNWLHDFDMTWRTKDGRRIPLSLSTTLLRNSLGEPIAMLSVARDITDRVRLMNDIARRNKQIELINRVVSKANETNDFEEIFGFLSQEITALLPATFINVGLFTEGYTGLRVFAVSGDTTRVPGDVIPVDRTVSRFVLEQSSPVIVNNIQSDPAYQGLDSVLKGVETQLSIPFRLKGRIAGTLNIGSTKRDVFTQDHIEILQPLAQHLGTIIDRVALFRQVREDSAYIRTLLDSLDSIVYTVDDQCRLREVNLAWNHFFHQAGIAGASEYYGRDLFEVLPSDELRAMFRQVIPDLIAGKIKMFSEEYTHRFPTDERVYQIIITPMSSGDRVKGLVFTHTDITALKRSETKLREFNEQLLTLNEIATFVNTAVDTGEMLDTALTLLQRVVKADGIIAFFPGDDLSELVAIRKVGLTTTVLPEPLKLDIARSATGQTYRTREPIFIMSDAPEDGRIQHENRPLLRSAGIQTMAVIPLVSKDRVVGVLDLFYTSAHHFTEQDRQILSLVGNQLGAAVETTRLYNELRSQVGRLTALYDLSARLTSVLEVDQIIRVVAENIDHLIPFSRLDITLCDAATKTQSGHFAVTPEHDRLDIQSFHTVHRLPESSPEYIVLDSGDSWFGEDRSVMAVAMLSKGTAVGVITLMSVPGSSYRDDQRLLLESLASLAAIALEKGRLYEETLRITEELRRRNKELDDFTYVVSHDLKEPLISIEGFSRILHADYAGIIEKEGKDYLDSVVGAATRMKGLIDDLLMLSRVSRPSESSGAVPMKKMLEEIRQDMAFTIRQKNVRLLLPGNLPEVWGNETHLKVLFRNLIGNAIKFNDKPDPVVEIGFRNAENNYYLFFVRDNGIGIEKEFFEKIFIIFQRLHRREEYEGSGAGLAIVKKIVEMHKGAIWVESEVNKGSTFYLTIPASQV